MQAITTTHPSRRLRAATVILLLVACVFGLTGCVSGESEPLTLNSLHYDVQVRADGDLRIQETWNVNMESRENDDGDPMPWHQLYRTFKDRPKVYNGIEDVSVTDIDTNQRYRVIDLPDPEGVSEDQYDELAGTSYLTRRDSTTTELGWNIRPTKSGTARFRIAYTAKNAITTLKDGAEFNWQFLDTSNGLYAKQVSGEIRWPGTTEDQLKNKATRDAIRAWLHFESQPSHLTIDERGFIRFSAEPLPSKMALEVHGTVPKSLIPKAVRTSDETVKSIADDEQRMADEWTAKQQARTRATIILCVVSILLLIGMLVWSIMAIRTSRRLSRYRGDMTYWRDDPGVSPAVAARLDGLDASAKQAAKNGMSATMLSLAHKRWIGLTMQLHASGRGQDVLITLRDAGSTRPMPLSPSEEALLAVLQRAGAGYRRPFTMSELAQAAKTDHTIFDSLFTRYTL